MSEQFSYERVPYPSFTFPQTSPHRLAAAGKYYGMQPADPRRCRVLELGCGSGTNLLLHGYDFPESEFVGIDLSEQAIKVGIGNAKEMGLSNVELRYQDILDFTSEKSGQFDYIIAHGLYSWVPDFVRTKILQIYEKCLSPDGIGYISYNVFPGCHVRQNAWEMMKYHVSDVSDPMEKVDRGFALLERLHEATLDPVYKSVLKMEMSLIADRSKENIFHDDLSEINQPFYFHEFVRDIEPFCLQFLNEVKTFTVSQINLAPQERQMLDALDTDVIRREQYLDFIRWQRFRRTLICRQEVELKREPNVDILNDFHIFSDITSVSEAPNILESKPETFTGTMGGTLEINHPLTKAALMTLKEIHPRSLPFQSLLGAAGNRLGNTTDEDRKRTASFILDLINAGFIDLQLFQPDFASEAGEFPVASAFVRWQVANGSQTITSLTGLNLQPNNETVMELLSLLDGTRDRKTLTAEMIKKFTVSDDERNAFEEEMPNLIEIHLSELAVCGVLLA